MSNKLKLCIPGKPIAAARPRVTRSGRAYLPKRTKEAKKKVADFARAHIPNAQPIEGAVSIVIRFYFAPPKTRYKEKLGGTPRPKKPDIDNLIKTVLDGLTAADVWLDDNLVIDISALKLYSNNNEDERTEVEIIDLGG